MENQSFGLGDTDPCIKSLQRALNEKLQLKLTCDGNMGKITQAALANYQDTLGISEVDSNGACYGPLTQTSLASFIQTKYLTAQDLVDAAATLGVGLASIKAVTATEAKEFGFLPNGFPVILFERHKFYQALVQVRGVSAADSCSAMSPDICNKLPGGYLGGMAELVRFNKAAAIHAESAYASTSWGLFQIMGFNCGACGYTTYTASPGNGAAQVFGGAMRVSEKNQLNAFVAFIQSNPTLHNALKVKDWKTFAKAYNGPNYYQSTPPYDVRLANNYTLALG